MADDFKGALERLAAAAQSAFQHAGDAGAARKALAAAARELAAAIESLPGGEIKGATKVEPRVDPKVPTVEPRVEPKVTGARPEDDFFRDLTELHKTLKASAYPFDPADYEWMAQIPQILKNFSDADKGGAKMTSFLASIIGKIDALLAFARHVEDRPSREAAKAARAKGLSLLALRGATGSETPGDVVKARSKSPAGTVLALLKTGFGEPARALVSSGDGTDASDLIETLAKAVGSDASETPEGRVLRVAILRKLQQYLTELPGKDADFETTIVRYALNEVHRIDGDEHCRPVLKFLAARGYNEILAQVGAAFDDSYSPTKFDRRKVPAPGAPNNSIVKIVQHGFANRQGVCVQKCVVAVASND